ncbi:Na/Pi symporter [Salinispirillum sp. LH 10-3-1]|uniref:Na/Pi symporter n=1 Tax=Salinispirillum sp. LH 10-3-1 TaxID=2952525 RepID=A0AB38YEL0_9GAMM
MLLTTAPVLRRTRLISSVVLLFVTLVFLATQPAVAGIAAGIGLFLLGMQQLENGLQTLSGGLLERALRHSTASTTRSVVFGASATALLQSSSLVTLLTMSFVGAGLITLPAAIAMLFGANLGTTTGAWLIAVFGLRIDMAALSMPMLALGLFLLRSKQREWLAAGQLLSGVGLLFLGIHFIKLGFEGLQGVLLVTDFAAHGFFAILLYTLIGIAATVVMQSSHASMLITLTALASGQISYDQGLAMAIGANIGTTVTAIIGALGGNAAARRLAASHVVFNVGTGIVALMLLTPLRLIVEGGAYLLRWDEHELTLRLALFHTLFNTLGLALTLPFLPRLSKTLEGYFQEPITDPFEPTEVKPQYLTPDARLFADTALTALEREYVHLSQLTLATIQGALGLAQAHKMDQDQWAEYLALPDSLANPVDAQLMYEQNIKPLYSDMVSFAYGLEVSRTPAQEKRERAILSAAQYLVEATKHTKHLQKNVHRLSRLNHPDIAAFYLQLRLLLSRVCMASHELVNDQEGPNDLGNLVLLSTWQKNFAAERVNEWQGALRNRRLDSRIATSLLNDMTYVQDLVEALQEAFTHYFADRQAEVSTEETGTSVANTPP